MIEYVISGAMMFIAYFTGVLVRVSFITNSTSQMIFYIVLAFTGAILTVALYYHGVNIGVW